jgi:hypothetical protein
MATVSVTNTDAQLSASTILTEEDAATIEALHTFDRDPNPPFAVSSGSAVVPNLDSDKLDGQEGSYYLSLVNATNWSTASLASASYSPTWGNSGTANAIGNGTLSGSAVTIGKLVLWTATILWGGTTTSGNGVWTLTTPSTVSLQGTIRLFASDNSAGKVYGGSGLYSGGTTVSLYPDINTAGGELTNVTSGVPFTWAQNDFLTITGWYISA